MPANHPQVITSITRSWGTWGSPTHENRTQKIKKMRQHWSLMLSIDPRLAQSDPVKTRPRRIRSRAIERQIKDKSTINTEQRRPWAAAPNEISKVSRVVFSFHSRRRRRRRRCLTHFTFQLSCPHHILFLFFFFWLPPWLTDWLTDGRTVGLIDCCLFVFSFRLLCAAQSGTNSMQILCE